MEMDRGAVLRVIGTGPCTRGAGGASRVQRTFTCPHDGGVNRQEEIAPGAGRGKHVDKLDAHRLVLRSNNQRSEIMGWADKIGSTLDQLHITPQFGAAGLSRPSPRDLGKVTMELLVILD